VLGLPFVQEIAALVLREMPFARGSVACEARRGSKLWAATQECAASIKEQQARGHRPGATIARSWEADEPRYQPAHRVAA